MHVYIQSQPSFWTVGFYDPDGNWHPESDHKDREKAAGRVHWLNGGSDSSEPEINPYLLSADELSKDGYELVGGRGY